MKQAMWVAVFAVAGAGVAAAQDERKVDELKREFDRAMKGLQEKFEAEKGRLEKEFKAAVERFKGPAKPEPKKDEGGKGKDLQPGLERLMERLKGLPKPEPRKDEGGKGKDARPNLEQLVERLIDRVDRLEKKLEGMGGLYRALPHDFDFKRFGDFKKFQDFKFEDWSELMPPRFRDFMEKRKGDEKEFRFEFKVPPGQKKKDKKEEEESF